VRTSLLGMAVHTTLSDSIRRQRSADEQMPVVQEGASRHGADGHANHLAAMMWEWRRPDEMALSRKPLSNGSKTGLLERQFDRVINHALCSTTCRASHFALGSAGGNSSSAAAIRRASSMA